MKTFYQLLTEAVQRDPGMEKAFQQAITTNPADALPWLVFADWLEERNDWRGPVVRAIGHLVQQPSEQTLGYVQQALVASGQASYSGALDRHNRVAIINHLSNQFFPYFRVVLERHPTLAALTHPNLTVEELEEHLPTGGELGGDWEVDDMDNRFVARNRVAVTNSNADVVGYVDFDVQISKNNPLEFHVNLDQGDIEAIEARYARPEEDAGEEDDGDDDGDDDDGFEWMDDIADDAPFMDDLDERVHAEIRDAIVTCLRQTGEV